MANWDKLGTSGDVEDRRGMGPVAGGGIGLIGIVVVLGIMFLGGDGNQASQILGDLQSSKPASTNTVQSDEFKGLDTYEKFSSTVLGSNNQYWNNVIQNYTAPRLVLFRESTSSGCGIATSEIGPHYCPEDRTLYLDETFFTVLTNEFKAKGGDVAQAYVIAHEVGHHVQKLLGTMETTQNMIDQNPSMRSKLSVAQELQADCYAGLWAKSVANKGVLEVGEIDEAIDTAEAVGDDRIQKETTGRVNPETWTHGSANQRKTWFLTGYNSGNYLSCDTFR